jgi:hypothetical protein
MVHFFLPLLLTATYAARTVSPVLIYDENRASIMDSEGKRNLRTKRGREDDA